MKKLETEPHGHLKGDKHNKAGRNTKTGFSIVFYLSHISVDWK